ncbi:MAG: tRNA 2-thiouridine(34) synthase MnmA [Polyangiales bacterium]
MVERMRVLVAMSGGVDSSLAAALLHAAGHEVLGVTLHLWDASGADKVGRCCAPEDRDEARRSCELLGIPHYVLDEREAFRSHVVDPFIAVNLAGKTPIPCVACNQQVKLSRLWQVAQTFGAARVATGHYARLQPTADGRVELLRGRDEDKDQSYFLFGVPQPVLQRMMFPLGELKKSDAREAARGFGLTNWDKPDSQELCFVPDRDVRGFVERQSGAAAEGGQIVDNQGQVLGEHRGITGFTIGQRRGIGVPGREPRYVLRIVPETRQVVVGSAEELAVSELTAESVTWTGLRPEVAFDAQVRIRSRHRPSDCVVTPTERGFAARFAKPEAAVAPGQAAVVYAGERVVGGGYIV